MIKLGVNQALVVSTSEMAKECLKTNDKAFVGRSWMVFVEHLTYNSAMMGFSPYCPYWRDIRKITTHELLSNHRLEMLKHVRITEVRSAIKAILDDYRVMMKSGPCSGTLLVDMEQWFNDVNLNTMVKLIAGKSMKEFYQGEKYNQC